MTGERLLLTISIIYIIIFGLWFMFGLEQNGTEILIMLGVFSIMFYLQSLHETIKNNSV